MWSVYPAFWCLVLNYVFISNVEGQDIDPTENLCHHDILPPEVLTLLQLSSAKILRGWNPNKDTSIITAIKESLTKINESIYTQNEETNDTLSSFEQLISQQKRHGKMLSTILNSNIDLLSDLNVLEDSSSKTSELILVNIKEQIEAKVYLSNMTKLLVDMYEILERHLLDTSNNIEENNFRKSREIEEKSLNLQLETHFLVKALLDGQQEEEKDKKRIMNLEDEIQNLNKEKEKLKKNIKKGHISRPADCHDIYISGIKRSGVYEIYPYRCFCSKPIKVWCDMKEEGGGWTVLLSRKKLPKQENFTRSWEEYADGFGDPTDEYWIGNEHLHALTSNRHYSLKINMQNRSGKKRFGQWSKFTVGSNQDNYELQVGGFSPLSTISKDILRRHNKQHFSTYDRDNDSSYDKNCARKFKGGWWYGRCFDVHPTGILLADDRKTAVTTSYFYYGRKSLIPLKRISLMVKPRSCASKSLDEDQDQSHSPACKPNLQIVL